MTFLAYGSNSKSLAEKISAASNVPIIKVLLKKFPDGENYILVDENGKNQYVKGHDVIIVQSMYPNQNDSLVEVMFLASTLVGLGARKIIGVIPYLAYSRQHKVYQRGESYSLKTIVDSLKNSGISKIVTVDTHFHRKPGRFYFSGLEFINLSAGRLLLKHIMENTTKDFVVIGPDFGSSEIIEFATGKVVVLKKEEICPVCKNPKTKCKCEDMERRYEVSKFEGGVDFKNKDVIILDDMITSGTTMIKAVEKIRNDGAGKVVSAATHGLFLKDSLETLKKITDYIVVTDSIETPVSKVSIAPLLAEAIK